MSDPPTPSGGLSSRLDDGVLTLTLDRAERGNLIDVALSDALHAALGDATWNDDVHVVVIEARGADFSRGIDGSSFEGEHGHEADRRAAIARLVHWRDRLLPTLPQPVIGSIRGACLGSAVAIVAACDLAFATDDATFMLDASSLKGRVPFDMSTIARVLPDDAAPLLRGCDAREAERIGLVTRCVPAGELAAEIGKLAAELAAKDPLALRFTKQVIRHVGPMSWEAAIDYGAAKFAQLKALQAGRPSPRAAAVESFLSGKSKPGLG